MFSLKILAFIEKPLTVRETTSKNSKTIDLRFDAHLKRQI